jgi:hypothetical protein
MKMRYYPRLKVFKSNRNWFDGVTARSYGWFIYAHVMINGEVIMASRYSRQTDKHMDWLISHMGHCKRYNLLAPNGLRDTAEMEREIKASIMDMKAQLANKRNRAMEWRRARLKELQEMLPILKLYKADLKAREKLALKALKAA